MRPRPQHHQREDLRHALVLAHHLGCHDLPLHALRLSRHLSALHEEDHDREKRQVRPQRPHRRPDAQGPDGRLVPHLPPVQEHRLHPLQGVYRPPDRQAQDGRVGRANLGH